MNRAQAKQAAANVERLERLENLGPDFHQRRERNIEFALYWKAGDGVTPFTLTESEFDEFVKLLKERLLGSLKALGIEP